MRWSTLATVGNSLQHDAQGFDKTRQDKEGVYKPHFHSEEERYTEDKPYNKPISEEFLDKK